MQNTTNWRKEKDPLRALFNVYRNFDRWKPDARQRFFKLFDRAATDTGDPKVQNMLSELRKAFEEVPQC